MIAKKRRCNEVFGFALGCATCTLPKGHSGHHACTCGCGLHSHSRECSCAHCAQYFRDICPCHGVHYPLCMDGWKPSEVRP